MFSIKNFSKLNRRDFLKTLSTAAIAAMFPRPLEILAHTPLPIGVLLPESTLYPGLGKSWLAGAKLVLDQGDYIIGPYSIRLIPENTGFTAGSAVRAVNKLANKRVKIITGMISPHLAYRLQDYFTKNRIFLITGNLGANVSTAISNCPFIYRHTLHTWQGTWAIGKWAAQKLGSRGIILSSFYESGFDTLQAFRLGFEQGGGQILGAHVTDAPIAEPGGLKCILNKIEEKGPDLLYTAFSGKSAAEFLQAYTAYGLGGKIPLIGAGMMADDYFLKAEALPFMNILTPSAWSEGYTAPENRAFISDFKGRRGYHPDAFSLLGYETLCLIVKALRECNGDFRNKERFARSLERIDFSGPRGRIFMNPLTHTTTGPVYLVKTSLTINGITHRVIGGLPVLKESDNRVNGLKSDKRSGWINMYLNV